MVSGYKSHSSFHSLMAPYIFWRQCLLCHSTLTQFADSVRTPHSLGYRGNYSICDYFVKFPPASSSASGISGLPKTFHVISVDSYSDYAHHLRIYSRDRSANTSHAWMQSATRVLGYSETPITGYKRISNFQFLKKICVF